MKKRKIIFSVVLLLTLSCFGWRMALQNFSKQERGWYECSNIMDIDSTGFKALPGKLYFQFNTDVQPSPVNGLGTRWIRDLKGYFTSYLINTSDSLFRADRQDASLIMIQEAMNEAGKWEPIEYWVYSGCGNSYFDPLYLMRGKYVMIPIKKYTGNFKTKIRLKLKMNKTIFYSEPFEGSISKRQFQPHTEKVDGILYHGNGSYLDEK